jgi:hypothetical protein
MFDIKTASAVELRDERARLLSEIDDILDTAKMASRSTLDREEQGRIDIAGRQCDQITRRLEAGGRSAGRGRHDYTPQANRPGGGYDIAERSLDGLLWATSDEVQAGSFDRTGTFRPNPHGARNPVDQVVIRSGSDGGSMLAPRINDLAAEDRQAVRAFQQTVADMALFGLLIDKSANTSAEGFQVARSHPAMADRWQHAIRALDIDTAAEGTEWVPTGIGASLHEKVRAVGKIAPLFSRIDIPTNPWKWPIEGGDATAYRIGEPTGDNESKMTASTPGTVATTFDAEIFGARTLFSRSLDADSAVVMVPFLRMKLVKAFVDAEEKAILDGDADGTHMDADVQAIGSSDARTAWDGLRKKALAQTVVTATTSTVANLAALRAGMGKWGLDPADLAFIVGVSAMHDLLADTTLLTLDKFGPHATILNGQIGSVYGIPVIVSEHVREDLNASGVQDGITQTKTYNLCVNRQQWVMGQRMALDVEVDDSLYRESFQRVMVAFQREDFASIASAATDDDTAISFNVTP